MIKSEKLMRLEQAYKLLRNYDIELSRKIYSELYTEQIYCRTREIRNNARLIRYQVLGK
jgi:hypothetical protein